MLEGGENDAEGRAMFYKNGEWGTICDKAYNRGGWPTVLCQELGFVKAIKAKVKCCFKYLRKYNLTSQ